MKCGVCGEDSLVQTTVQRFHGFAVALWIVASALVFGAGIVALINLPYEPAAIGSVLGGMLSFFLVASLVLSGTPAWGCAECGHWVHRAKPPRR